MSGEALAVLCREDLVGAAARWHVRDGRTVDEAVEMALRYYGVRS
jgi:hypothetical protein